MEKRGNRSHYKIIGETMVPKKTYETEQEALMVARFVNTLPKTIHKKVVYKCIKCGKWHIGTNHTLLTEEDKQEIARKLENEAIWKGKESRR